MPPPKPIRTDEAYHQWRLLLKLSSMPTSAKAIIFNAAIHQSYHLQCFPQNLSSSTAPTKAIIDDVDQQSDLPQNRPPKLSLAMRTNEAIFNDAAQQS